MARDIGTDSPPSRPPRQQRRPSSAARRSPAGSRRHDEGTEWPATGSSPGPVIWHVALILDVLMLCTAAITEFQIGRIRLPRAAPR